VRTQDTDDGCSKGIRRVKGYVGRKEMLGFFGFIRRERLQV
jgi:hypothetical protein